MTEWFWVYQL